MPRVWANATVIELGRKRAALIHDGAAREAVAEVAVVQHRLKIAVGVRVVQWTVFAKALHVISALDVMLERLDRVARREQVAVAVELDPPRVAAPFGKQ